MTKKTYITAVALAGLTGSGFAATTLFEDNMDGLPDPDGVFYGPGGAAPVKTWYMPDGSGPVDEYEPGSVKSYTNSTNWDPSNAVPVTYLQLGYARGETVRVLVAFEETWDTSKDYRLSFDLSTKDNGATANLSSGAPDPANMNLKAQFFGMGMQDYQSGSPSAPPNPPYIGAHPTGATFGAAPGVMLHETDLSTEITSFGPQSMEVVVSGAEVAAASQAGNQIYFAFWKGWNSEHHYVDNVVFEEGSVGEFDVVPEPSSTALLGLGGLALLMRRRR